MLVHRPKRPSQRVQREKNGDARIICLVPELCYLTGLSDNLRSDFKAMKEIKEVTCQPPNRRMRHIEEFLQRINNNQDAKDELLRWGLHLDMYASNTMARQFPPESIMVGGQQVFKCGPDADFTRDVTRSSVIRPVSINQWLLIFTRRDANKAEQFFRKMVDVSRKIGMEINKPHFIELRDDRSTSYKDAISSSVTSGIQLVVCIFPTSRDDRYSAVKKLCCVDMPVPSQVILSRTLPEDPKLGKFRSITMKIALQINCKLGGELWAVDIPLKELMICGIDVYHDAGGKGHSVAAFVASTNKLLTRWYSRAILQQPQQELISSLKPCFTEAIKKFYEVNHALPSRVVIFRDGVGDGQLKEVSEHEVSQLSSCFGMFENIAGGPYEPKLTVVIVSKRINVKLFAKQNENLVNPPPGLVLDHLATRPNWPDFFLVSQHVRQGTVSPTHYIVVSGGEHLKADHMQRLAYKLTYMYYNWPGTVRVPAPCQYAHKLAYLVGQSIRQEPSTLLSDRLFYL
uniref:Piwi-like protein 2 n=1 Tax=Phallusia mammillata TaxID=59560 RepID=A0A6F9DPK0_9ASCI|nr:piwi-like protein 2 [Phallusia mammillata]